MVLKPWWMDGEGGENAVYFHLGFPPIFPFMISGSFWTITTLLTSSDSGERELDALESWSMS